MTPEPVLPAFGRRGEGAVARLDLIEHQIAVVADGDRLTRRDLHLPLTLIAGVGGAGRGQGKRLGLRGEAAEYVLAVAVLGVGERQQAVLDLRRLRRDRARSSPVFGARCWPRAPGRAGSAADSAPASSALSSVLRPVCALLPLAVYCWLCASTWL